jgi:hypothetical protein
VRFERGDAQTVGFVSPTLQQRPAVVQVAEKEGSSIEGQVEPHKYPLPDNSSHQREPGGVAELYSLIFIEARIVGEDAARIF